MIQGRENSSLIEVLYAAPLDAERWDGFFGQLCQVAECEMGVLTTSSPAGQEALAGGGLNFNPEPLRLYNEHYGSVDPLIGPSMRNIRAAVIPDAELVKRDEFTKTEFFNDLLTPFGLHHVTVIPCLFTKDAADFVTVFRSKQAGPLDGAAAQFLEDLLPHMQSALRLHHVVRRNQLQADVDSTLLHSGSQAVFALNHFGKVIYSNAKADRLAAAGDGISLRNGLVKARRTAEDTQLQMLVRLSMERVSGSKTASVTESAATGTRVTRKSGGHLRIVAIPIAGRGEISSLSQPRVLLLIDDPSEKRQCGDLMRTIYGFTPVEVRLADLLLQGLQTKELGPEVGLSHDAVRFHLKKMFAKTSTRKQSELMQLMMSLPSLR